MESLKQGQAELNEDCNFSDEQSRKLFDLFKDLVDKKVELSHKYQDSYTAQIEKKDLQDPIFMSRGINLVTFDYWTHYRLPTGVEKPCVKIMTYEITNKEPYITKGDELAYDASKDTITSIFIINNEVKPDKNNPLLGEKKYYTFYDQEVYDFEKEEVGYEKWHLKSCPYKSVEIETLIGLLESLKPERQ